MKSFIISFTLCTLFFSGIQAQENQEKRHDIHHVGLTAGWTTGVGLSYRYWPGKLGVQAALLPVYNSNDNEGYNFLSLGLTGLYKLSERTRSNLFLYGSGHYLNSRLDYTKDKDNPGLGETTAQVGRFNAGSGVGIDARMLGNDDLRFNFMLGIAGYNLATSVAEARGFGINMTAEASIFFRF
jgi:hypothetical protein